MQRVFAARLGLLLGMIALGASAQAADDAAAIVRRAGAAMAGSKSYQGTWENTTSMGQMGSMTINMEMKMLPGSGKSYIKMSPTGQATGMMAMGAAFANSTIVDDGKTMFMYMQAMNGYMKMPHGTPQSGQVRTPMQLMGPKGATYKIVGTEKVGRSICSVIEVNAPLPPQMKSSGMATKTTLYIDKASNKLMQIKQLTTMPAGMMGGAGGGAGANAAPQQLTTMMVPKTEKLNEHIPDSFFKFTPPPGVKEIKGGLGGMMSGMRRGAVQPTPKSK